MESTLPTLSSRPHPECLPVMWYKGTNYILHTQTLTAEFCAKYILDEKRTTCIEDEYLIDIGYVLRHQKHIKREDLEYYYDLYNL